MQDFQITIQINIHFLQELGTGWTPAIANDTEELEFIQDKERISADDNSYWIGGLAYKTLESQEYSEGNLLCCF